jgi:SAM-dependent methyltransferase
MDLFRAFLNAHTCRKHRLSCEGTPVNHAPFYADADQNKGPILDVIREVFTSPGTILEVGSGTGQHAVHFAQALPHLVWQPSEVHAQLPAIEQWRRHAGLANILPPIVLDVATFIWPEAVYDGAYSCNTAHILPLTLVEQMLRGIARALRPGGHFCLYGPFRYGVRHTAPSNARFDALLQARDPLSGVRDAEHLDRLAAAAGLEWISDQPMPANNRTLVWRRRAD